MAYETLLLEVRERVAVVQMNRPKRLNAINFVMGQELRELFAALSKNDEVRVLVLTGSGEKAFSAGADISDVGGFTLAEDVLQGTLNDLIPCRSLERFPKPTIAAINGLALGGGLEMALCCDFALAAETAQLAFPEINLGIIPNAGGTQRLTRLVGPRLAKEIMFLGKPFSASEARDFGLIRRVMPLPHLLPEAEALAQELAGKAPLALRALKRLVNLADDVSLEAGLTMEAQSSAYLYQTQDRQEGMQAFREKRPPNFKGQ